MNFANHTAGWAGMIGGLGVLWATNMVFYWKQETRLNKIIFSADASLGKIAMQYGVGSTLTDKYTYMFGVGEFVFGISMLVSLFVYEGKQRRIFSFLSLGMVLILSSTFILHSFGPMAVSRGPNHLMALYVMFAIANGIGLLFVLSSIGYLSILETLESRLRALVKVLVGLGVFSGASFFFFGTVSVKLNGSFLPGIVLLIFSLLFSVAGGIVALVFLKSSYEKNVEDKEPLIIQ